MAIQSRQGSYSDFDPNKMLPGEWACVRKGDPKAEDGRAVYMAFEPGVVKRMATHEDIVDQVKEAFGDAAEELAAEFTEEMRTATDNATVAAKDAEQAVKNANKAVEDANTATSNANDAADKANEAAEKAESAGVDIDYSEIEFDTEEIVVEDPQEPEREIVSDAYKTTGSYAVGDYCIYENKLYRCIADTSGEFDVTCWEKTLVASELKTLNANLNDIGSMYYIPIGEVSIASGATTTLGSLTLSPGVYTVMCELRWPANSSGIRSVVCNTNSVLTYLPHVYQNSNCILDAGTVSFVQNHSYTLGLASETTLYFHVFQNSGSTLSCNIASITAAKIGNIN